MLENIAESLVFYVSTFAGGNTGAASGDELNYVLYTSLISIRVILAGASRTSAVLGCSQGFSSSFHFPILETQSEDLLPRRRPE